MGSLPIISFTNPFSDTYLRQMVGFWTRSIFTICIFGSVSFNLLTTRRYSWVLAVSLMGTIWKESCGCFHSLGKLHRDLVVELINICSTTLLTLALLPVMLIWLLIAFSINTLKRLSYSLFTDWRERPSAGINLLIFFFLSRSS